MELQQEKSYEFDFKLCYNEEIEKIPKNVKYLILRWSLMFDVLKNKPYNKNIICVTDWSFLEKFTELESLYIYIGGKNESFLQSIENKVVNLPVSLKDLIIFNKTKYCIKNWSFLEKLVNLDCLYYNEKALLFSGISNYTDNKKECEISQEYLNFIENINIVLKNIKKKNKEDFIMLS